MNNQIANKRNTDTRAVSDKWRPFFAIFNLSKNDAIFLLKQNALSFVNKISFVFFKPKNFLLFRKVKDYLTWLVEPPEMIDMDFFTVTHRVHLSQKK